MTRSNPRFTAGRRWPLRRRRTAELSTAELSTAERSTADRSTGRRRAAGRPGTGRRFPRLVRLLRWLPRQAAEPARRVAYLPPGEALAASRIAASPLASTSFVIVDVETTGWHPGQAAITEIGAVRFAGGEVTAEFSALVNPGSPIPPDISALTGITDDMVRQAPPMAAVLPAFLAFAGDCVLTAHNAPFDVGFLTAACGSCAIPWPSFGVVDTAVLARLLLDDADVPDCKLATLAAYFGARTRPCHRALADAKATAEVFQGLLGRLAAAGARTLADIGA